jgi:hypothetical protein
LELFWLFENFDPSCPDLIRASINLRSKPFSKKMDHRVKPGDDDLNWHDRHCEERLVRRSATSEGGSDEAIHCHLIPGWIASRSLPSGAHSRDPLAPMMASRQERSACRTHSSFALLKASNKQRQPPGIFSSRINARVTGGPARWRVDHFMVPLPAPTPLD